VDSSQEYWRTIGMLEGRIQALERQQDAIRAELVRHDEMTGRRVTAWGTAGLSAVLVLGSILWQVHRADVEDRRRTGELLQALAQKVIVIESQRPPVPEATQ